MLRDWGLPLITDSEHEGLECQIDELGINAEGKEATEGCGVGGAAWGWQEARGAPLPRLLLTHLSASEFSEAP